MKLVSYSKGDSVSCGILTDSGIIDIAANWTDANPPRSVKTILQRGKSCLDTLGHLAESSQATIAVDQVKLLAPVQQPGKLLIMSPVIRSAMIYRPGR